METIAFIDHIYKRERMMLNRIAMTAAFVGLTAGGVISTAQAQQPNAFPRQETSPSGWTFNLAPYLWMPSINADLNFTLPPALGGTVSATSSVGFGDLVSHLNFGAMVAADARYDRFSILTDFIYMNVSGTAAQFKSLNFFGNAPVSISGSAQASQSLSLKTQIWTQSGGYSLLQGDWGNLDAIAGFRYMGVNARINYSLGVTVVGPRGNGATFGGVGSVSGSGGIWNGIGGFRGSLRLGDSAFFVPYYFDIGAGGSNLTWQVASGLGYKTPWVDLALTYRYLSFQQGSSSVLQHLWIKGPMITANFEF